MTAPATTQDGGYGQQGRNGHQQHRERLWRSPHCLEPAVAAPSDLLNLTE